MAQRAKFPPNPQQQVFIELPCPLWPLVEDVGIGLPDAGRETPVELGAEPGEDGDFRGEQCFRVFPPEHPFSPRN